MRKKKLLILGGTGEGIALATALATLPEYDVISSLAGRVADPKLPPGEIRIGGFGGIEGLKKYLTENGVTAMIDATHPFARRIGWNAFEAAARADIRLLRFERPAWVARSDDRWIAVDDWRAAVDILQSTAKRVFLTLGRQELEPFASLKDVALVIRSVELPDPKIYFSDAKFILARGPFNLDAERMLLQSHNIDHLVCKNSGGDATYAKLQAARELGMTVVMQNRPIRPDIPQVSSIDNVIQWVKAL